MKLTDHVSDERLRKLYGAISRSFDVGRGSLVVPIDNFDETTIAELGAMLNELLNARTALALNGPVLEQLEAELAHWKALVRP